MKDPENGVHYRIERLKKASRSDNPSQHKEAEQSLLDAYSRHVDQQMA